MSLEDDFVRTGDHGERFVEILPEFFGTAGASWVIPCDLAAAGEGVSGVFKTDDVIALPRMNSDRC